MASRRSIKEEQDRDYEDSEYVDLMTKIALLESTAKPKDIPRVASPKKPTLAELRALRILAFK